MRSSLGEGARWTAGNVVLVEKSARRWVQSSVALPVESPARRETGSGREGRLRGYGRAGGWRLRSGSAWGGMLSLGLLWRALSSVGHEAREEKDEHQEHRRPEAPSRTAAAMEQEQERALEVYDIIRTIRDPEKPNTLEELDVVTESCVEVQEIGEDEYLVTIRFTPTVPHCSLATLIGLCLRIKLQRCLPFKHKLEIYISEGAHSTEEDINKQINDKERVAAAMENPHLREVVEQCVLDPD